MKNSLVAVCACVLVLAGIRTAAAATINVPAGGNLQAALDAAAPGDTIQLAAGAVFTGNFLLRAKGGSAVITIRSATPDSALPPDGTRITPAYAGVLAKIRSDRNGAAIRTAPDADNWRLQFLEVTQSAADVSANLIELGDTDSTQSTVAAAPQHLVIDRCYIHGVAGWNMRRGIALNSGDTQILNSYISDIKGVNQDTQAIAGWNGPGPFLIENNYLEAAGENLLLGGSSAAIPNLVPSHVTIRRNTIAKNPAWRTMSYTLKNLLEFKNVDTALIEGNTFEYNWSAGQQGYSIVLTPRNQGGTEPETVVQNVTIRSNIIRHVAAVFNISGYDDLSSSRQTNHIEIANNLIYDVSTAYAVSGHSANGWLAVIGNGPRDIAFDHNTVDNDGNDTIFIYAGKAPTGTAIYGLEITNNLLRDNLYGIFGDGSQEGAKTFQTYAPDAYFAGNTYGTASPQLYPGGNYYPTLAQWLADFVNRAAGDYSLLPGSLSRGAALDGTDAGVNLSSLASALAASGGNSSSGGGSSSTGSSPFMGTPIALPGRIEAENYDKGGEGVAYHDTTSGNSTGAYRSDDVDIRTTTDSSGRYNVKSVRAGEWLAYSVSIANTGSYSLGFRVASSGTGGTVHVELDGANVTGAIALPDTGGWDTYRTFTTPAVTLSSGAHVLKVVIDANGSGKTAADINWIDVAPAAGGSSPYSGAPAALPGTIQAEDYDKGGEGVGYHDTTSGNSTGGLPLR